MPKIHCGDFVKTPKGSGRVFACPADENPGNILVTPTGNHLEDWFACPAEEAVITEPTEQQLIDLEFWTLRKKWLDILK